MTEDRRPIKERLLHWCDPAEIDMWLVTPNPALDNQVPAVLIAQGSEDVHELLDHLDDPVGPNRRTAYWWREG